MSRAFVVICLSILLATAGAAAQSVDVTLNGLVTDQTGAVVPGVIVTVTNSQTGVVRSGVSDNAGIYRVAPLPPGTYDVKAELAGFQPKTVTAQSLHVGTVVTLDFRFDALTAAQDVEVVGSAPVLETSKNTLSRIVRREELSELPVVDRNFNNLASLVPGVTVTGIYGGVDISGSRDYQNGYSVDGVSAEGIGAGDQRIGYAQDWIEEFQVLTSQYNAEFGRSSGGAVNAITRSGSNITRAQVHGYGRNDAWDARPAFASTKPPLSLKRVGATTGGKLIADRLFFFGGFEWYDTDTSSVVNSSFPDENGNVPSTSRRRLYLVKLEHHAADANVYRFRFNGETAESTGLGTGGISTREHGQSAAYDGTEAIASWTRVLSPTLFNELRGGFTRTTSDTMCNYARSHPEGTWFERVYPAAAFGCANNFGIIQTEEAQLIENLSWLNGTHDVKAGIQMSRARSFGDYRFARDGIYRFPTDTPFVLSDPASYPVFFTIFQGPTVWDYPIWTSGGFVQDSWRIGSKVTLNAGVRYDLDWGYTALNALLRTDKGLNAARLDRNNAAPRVGAAWTPTGNRNTLLRGGVGVFYDQTHGDVSRLLMFNSILTDRSLTMNANLPGLNPFGTDVLRARRFLADALATNSVPDVSLLPGVVAGTPDIEPDLQIPYSVQVSGGISRLFSSAFAFSADIVYVRGKDQYVIRDANYDKDAALAGRTVRINPNYSFINRYDNGGRFNYRALQLQMSFEPNARRILKVAYTLSKNESNTNTALRGIAVGAGATNPFDYDEDYGPTDNDIRHNLSVNGVATLLFDVQLSGILSARSALPWSVVSSSQLDADPFADRPEPRNSRRGDTFISLDMRLSKAVRFATRRSAAVFVEIYNATNATNLLGYVGTLGSSQFGVATNAAEKRRVQLGLRVEL